jgi:hypothetical protein
MAGSLVVLARQSPLNGGTTVAGAQLFVYDAGTTTKRAVYTTSALAVQHSNPVVADANGRFAAVWINPAGGDYKTVLALPGDTDPPTSPIWTDDNFPGRIPDSSLSSNVALLDAANVFGDSVTGSHINVFKNADNGATSTTQIRIQDDSTNLTYFGITSSGWTGGAVLTGGPTGAQGWVSTSGSRPLAVGTNNTVAFSIDTSQNFNFYDGTVTTLNLSASEIGWKGSPVNEQNGDYTLVLTDAGKTIYKASGGAGETITIPANASVAFPIGTKVKFINNGGGNLSIAISSDTLLHTAGSGTRTLATSGKAEALKVAATVWVMDGSGLT